MVIRVFRAQVIRACKSGLGKRSSSCRFHLWKAKKGLVASYSGKPTEAAPDEFVMVTIWRTLADVKAFAGENWNRSVIPDEELPLLSETFVHHYEVIGSSAVPNKKPG